MIPFSILDLSQISEGSSISDALANSARMAQGAESAGYKRYWLAEHHGMPGIASAATAIVIAHVGAATPLEMLNAVAWRMTVAPERSCNVPPTISMLPASEVGMVMPVPPTIVCPPRVTSLPKSLLPDV